MTAAIEIVNDNGNMLMRRGHVVEHCRLSGLRLTFALLLVLIPAVGAIAVPPAAPDLKALKDEMEHLMDQRRTILEEIQALPDRSAQSRELWDQYDRLGKETSAIDRRIGEEMKRLSEAELERIKTGRCVIYAHPASYAVLSELYGRFVATSRPQRTSPFSLQLYSKAIENRKVIESVVTRDAQLGIIALHTQCEEEELAALWHHPIQPVRVPFASAVTVVIVHPRNPIRQMTFEQVENAYRPRNAKWPGPHVGDRRIERIGTGYPLLSCSMFTNRILKWKVVRFPEEAEGDGPDPFRTPSVPWAEFVKNRQELRNRFPGGGPFPQYQDDAKVAQEVAKRIGAIGYCLLEPNVKLPEGVNALSLSPGEGQPAYAPTPENIWPVTERTRRVPTAAEPSVQGGGYPLVKTLLFYVHPEASVEAHQFLAFATGSEGAQIIRQFGLWPEYELEEVRGEQRVAEVKAGKGQPVAVCDLAGVGEAIKAASWEFARAKMAVQVTLDSGGGSAEAAVARFKTGEAELMVVDGGLEEEGLRGQGMEEGGERMVLGSRAVGVVVHPGNSFNELTMDDLRQILAGKVDRWPGATGTAERIVLYTLPLANPLMPLVDRAMGADVKRGKVTVRPDSQRVMLSVAAQPGALGLVDLTKIARHETKVKLLAILPPGETEAATAAPDRVPEAYPLASPVALHLSPKASDAARAFFSFLNEGGGRDALLAGGLIPRPLPEAMEAEIAAAYGVVDGLTEEPEATGPPAQVAVAKEDDAPATASPDHLQDVLRGALGGSAGASPAGVASAAAPAGADRPTPGPQAAEKKETIASAPGEGDAPHPVASEPPPAGAADFAAWITARAVPIGLIGLCVTVVAVALGSLGMKRARHRNDVMRRYRP